MIVFKHPFFMSMQMDPEAVVQGDELAAEYRQFSNWMYL